MDWVNAGQFQLIKLPGRHYVYHRDASGQKIEMNVPTSVITARQARNYLLSLPLPLTCNLPSKLRSFRPIGKGRQGIAFLAEDRVGRKFILKVAPRDLKAEQHHQQQPAEIEFRIQKAVGAVAPDAVVIADEFLKCKDFIPPSAIDMKNVQNPALFKKDDQSIIKMEWCDGGTLKNYIRSPTVNDKDLYNGLIRLLKGLLKIRSRYPEFRHNDLYADNVFVCQGVFKLGDFGWARLEKYGTNPAVNSANGTTTATVYGIGPSTDKRYDHHLLLNELREILKTMPAKFPKTLTFVNRAIPHGYRGQKDVHVSEWRLKYRDPCDRLPDIPDLIKEPVRSANLLAMKAKLRKPVRPPKVVMSAKLFLYVRKNPVSGRIQVISSKGRWVYANRNAVKLQNLRNMAIRHGISLMGVKTKKEIAQKILSAKNI